jgi:hypothetical protein
MFSNNSPEGRAFGRARAIDTVQVRDRAERAADEGAFGRAFPDDHEAYMRLVSELIEAEHPRDGTAWLTAKNRSIISGYFPQNDIAEWFGEAGIEDAPGAAQAFAGEIGLICEAYRQERVAAGIAPKHAPHPAAQETPRRKSGRRRLKASGLGNRELRKAVAAASSAADQFANALGVLRDEALRPGQAGTIRGNRVRALYVSAIATLLSELGQAARLDRHEAAMLQLVAATIEVEGDRYVASQVPWELALFRLARSLERRADEEGFWASLPSAHGSITGARDRWIGRLGSVFERATGAEPTFTGRPAPSQFLRFMAAAQGHMAGLAFARNDNPDAARRNVEAQGLDQVFSAPTYQAAWRAHKNNSDPVSC